MIIIRDFNKIIRLNVSIWQLRLHKHFSAEKYHKDFCKSLQMGELILEKYGKFAFMRGHASDRTKKKKICIKYYERILQVKRSFLYTISVYLFLFSSCIYFSFSRLAIAAFAALHQRLRSVILLGIKRDARTLFLSLPEMFYTWLYYILNIWRHERARKLKIRLAFLVRKLQNRRNSYYNMYDKCMR